MLASALLLGCGGFIKGKAAGERAVAQFHALYNQGKIGDIWQSADGQFRAATTRPKFEELMAALQRKLGKVVSTSNVNWRVQSFNMKSSVLLSQTTTFEHGNGTESFSFALNGTNALLLGYNIQSMDLITK